MIIEEKVFVSPLHAMMFREGVNFNEDSELVAREPFERAPQEWVVEIENHMYDEDEDYEQVYPTLTTPKGKVKLRLVGGSSVRQVEDADIEEEEEDDELEDPIPNKMASLDDYRTYFRSLKPSIAPAGEVPANIAAILVKPDVVDIEAKAKELDIGIVIEKDKDIIHAPVKPKIKQKYGDGLYSCGKCIPCIDNDVCIEVVNTVCQSLSNLSL